jgi:transcriptional regulator with XRE-family HTH domain
MSRDAINQAVGYRLKMVRDMNGFRQSDFALLFSTSQARVSIVEAGLLDIPPEWLVILADKFRINPLYLLGMSKDIYFTQAPKGYPINSNIPYIQSPVQINRSANTSRADVIKSLQKVKA